MQLFAFVTRKEGTTHDEFLRYWRESHGPLIRDTPDLADRLVRYEQHASHPNDRSGYDGVAVQTFASWDDFLAMISGPAGEAMRIDEGNFLQSSEIKVVFTDEPVVVVGSGSATDSAGSATDSP